MADRNLAGAVIDIVRLSMVVLVDRVVSHFLPKASGDLLLLVQEAGVAVGSAAIIWFATEILLARPQMQVRWAERGGATVRGSSVRLERTSPRSSRWFQITIQLSATSRLAQRAVATLRGSSPTVTITFNPAYSVNVKVDKIARARARSTARNIIDVDLDTALADGTVASFQIELEAGRSVDSNLEGTVNYTLSCAAHPRWARWFRVRSNVNAAAVVKVS